MATKSLDTVEPLGECVCVLVHVCAHMCVCIEGGGYGAKMLHLRIVGLDNSISFQLGLLIIPVCPGLRDFFGYEKSSSKTGQVPGK